MLKLVEYRHENDQTGDSGRDLRVRFETRDEAKRFLASHLENTYPASGFTRDSNDEEGTWWVRGKVDRSFYRRFAIEGA